jgi:hypothetical protein
MAYIGNTPTVGAFRKMDSIQASFDGSTTQFSIQVGGSTYQPQNANVIVCAKDGVLLEPGVDFTVTDATFTFTTAPTNGQTFFAIILGDVLDTGTPIRQHSDQCKNCKQHNPKRQVLCGTKR